MVDGADRKYILIVDDAPANIAVITGVLKGEYRLRAATDGRRALSLIASGELPDLVLLDIMMPEMDGYDVCRQIKSDPRTRDIPVIFLTALSSMDAEAKGFDLGAVDYISKPISPPIVRARVKAQIALKASSDALRIALDDARTANHRLQETLKHLVQVEKMAALGQLVAGMAHEINTPLGIAVTITSYLIEQNGEFQALADSGKMRRSDVDSYFTKNEQAYPILTRNLDRAAALVDTFKQVAIDHTSDERHRFDLKTFLDDLAFVLRSSWHDAGHALEVTCPEALEIDGYPAAITQILTNLVANSVSHAYEPGQSGRLTIGITAVAPAAADAADSGMIELVYADDGCGIPAARQARVFDPFFTTRRAAGNPGLGLHIVFNLVTGKLGGRIELDSDESKGARFIIRFPRTTAPVPPGAEAGAEPE